MRSLLDRFAKPALLGVMGLSGAFALTLFELPARAMSDAQRGVYVIPTGGYGVDECVAKSSECGRIVAAAWCEAHGHGRVVAFGSANDVTFSANASVKAPPPNSILISCAD